MGKEIRNLLLLLILFLTTFSYHGQAIASFNNDENTESDLQISARNLQKFNGDQNVMNLIEEPVEINKTGQYDDNDPGTTYDAEIKGNYAFIAESLSGMEIFDISDPTQPVKVSTFRGYGTAVELILEDDLAYVAYDYGGVYIVNISDPLNPTQVSFTSDTIAAGIAIEGNYLYVANRNAGLDIINITDIKNPTLVGSFYDGNDGGSGEGVAVTGNFALLADGNGGLEIIDVSNKSNPIEVSSYESLIGYSNINNTKNVVINGSYAYLADNWEGAEILDISDPLNPTLVYRIENTNHAENLLVQGNFLYAATSGGFTIHDVSDPTNPVYVGEKSNDVRYRTTAVNVNDSILYLSSLDRGMEIFDISDKSLPVMIGKTYNEGITYDLIIDGNYGYAADYDAGIEVYDISNKSNPIEIGNYTFDTGLNLNKVYKIDKFGTTLFAYEDNNGVMALDVSDPTSITEIGWIHNSASVNTFELYRDILAVVDTSDIIFYNISNPSNPVDLGSLNLAQSTQIISIEENYLYLIDNNDLLQIYNIEDPSNPQFSGNLTLTFDNTFSYPRDLYFNGSNLFISVYASDLIVLDISDKTNPVINNDYASIGDPLDIKILGGLAFITLSSLSLQILNLTNPSSPTLITHYTDSDISVNDVELLDNYFYIGAGIDGTIILRMSGVNGIPPSPPREIGLSESSNGIEISWNAPLHVYYQSLIQYQILRMANGLTTVYNISAVLENQLLDGDVQIGTNYSYQIRALSNAGYSEYSSVHSIEYGEIPPSPNNLDTFIHDNGSVSILWDFTANQLYGTPTFNVYRGVTETNVSLIQEDIEDTHYLDTTLEPGNTYYYQISAENIMGESILSDVISVIIEDDSGNDDQSRSDGATLNFPFPFVMMVLIVTLNKFRSNFNSRN